MRTSHSTIKKIVRYPLLSCIFLVIFIECSLYFFVRLLILIFEFLVGICFHYRREENRLLEAKNYSEFRKYAQELDLIKDREKQKSEPNSHIYDQKLVQQTYNQLLEAKEKQNQKKILQLLTVFYQKRSHGYGLDSELLYSKTYFGTKKLVSDFLKLVLDLTQSIHKLSEEKITVNERYMFFKIAQKNFGTTALCLSGGAKMGFYHFGLIKALLDEKMLPNLICGTSLGALVAAFVCVRTRKELEECLGNSDIHTLFLGCDESQCTLINRFIRTGYFYSFEYWRHCLISICLGDTTFAEAYQRTGFILNITSTSKDSSSKTVLLNYRTAPNVCIQSAVLASSALPRILEPCELYAKNVDGSVVPFHAMGRFQSDGSFRNDIPIKLLRELQNVAFTIVSQANPHVVPFSFENEGSSGKPSRHRSGIGLRGGFLLSGAETFLKIEMRKQFILLQELDLFPHLFGHDQSHVALQKFRGNITILANVRQRDYLRLLSDPSQYDFERYLIRGRRSCQPKLCMIEHRMMFNHALQLGLQRCDILSKKNKIENVSEPKIQTI